MKKIYLLVASVIVLFVFFSVAKFTPNNSSSDAQYFTPSPKTNFDAPSSLEIYNLINAHRRSLKLTPLQPNLQLEKSANLKIQDMISKKYYDHLDKQQAPNWTFLTQSGYTYQTAGENLSFGHNSAWKIFDAWMESKIHRQQLESPNFLDFGLAIDCDKLQPDGQPYCICVLHLGKK